MGITCKPIAKFKSVIAKIENKLEEEKKTHKSKKGDKKEN